MVPVDLVLFDCDGVLIDSELISGECAAAELAQVGMHLSAEEVLQRFLGRSRKEIAGVARQAGHPVPVDFVERLEARIHQRFEQQLCAIDGVRDILTTIQCAICVASGSSLSYIHRALNLTCLSSPFGDHLFSAAMVRHPKPAPDLFLYAAAKMNVLPPGCLVVEDSLTGVMAAKAAQMPVVGFLGGSHLRPEMVRADYYAAGCQAVFDSMQEFGTYLKTLGAIKQQ